MSHAADINSGLTPRQAEIVGRQFNSAVTNTSAYGSDHPVSERAYDTFLSGLGDGLEKLDSLTLMLDRGSFFVEDHPVDEKFNSGRLVNLFRKLGLESVTFSTGVDADDLKRLMIAVTSSDEFPDIESIRQELARCRIEAIKVNHVVLRKFTNEDEVISRGGLEELTGLAEQALSGSGTAAESHSTTQDLHARVDKVISMRGLLQQPGQLAEHLLHASSADAERQDEIMAEIRKLGTQVENAAAGDANTVSPEKLMQAITRVREEISNSLAGREEAQKLMAEGGGVLSELDQLTCRTVVSIVREEYQHGQVSVQRLAQIIRRILPESRDLRRLLPMLKQALLADGMGLDEYIEFVNQLASELKSDALIQALEQGADSAGFTVDELLREIRREPEEAARLIVLASELREGGRNDEHVLSTALSEYIERVSGDLVEQGAGGDPHNLREEIKKTQQDLVDRIRAQGIPESVAERIEAGLDVHVDRSTKAFRASRIVELLEKNAAADDSELADRLVQVVEREPHLSTLGDTLQRELRAHGYSAERVDSIYGETLARLKRKSRVEFIPGTAMNPVATGYFLKREIATCIRYDTFFSAIMLMIAQVREPGQEWRTISPDEIESLMPEVFDVLPPHLRDLDLLGTLGSKDRNVPLAILPMTGEDGARAVMERMLEALDQAHLELGGSTVEVNAIGTAARFDPEHSSDAKSFVHWLRGRLATQLVARLRGI